MSLADAIRRAMEETAVAASLAPDPKRLPGGAVSKVRDAYPRAGSTRCPRAGRRGLRREQHSTSLSVAKRRSELVCCT